MDTIISLGISLVMLLLAYFVGSDLERRHFADIRKRELANRGFPIMTLKGYPESWHVVSSGVVTGNVVVSLDYFKRLLASLRNLVGGRVTSYEPLLDRARREALLRMIEVAKAQGYNAIVNVRLETSRLASARGDGKGTSGVEMLAFGTGVKYEQ